MRPSTDAPKRYLRAPEVARYLGLSPATLAKMRITGDGPAFSKAGCRAVVYALADLDDWLASRRRTRTASA
jgi:predicted DNA-binding transcriptional regulator AlpA